MRDYAKIAPTFWTGDTGKKIRGLGLEAQLIALYLLTNPHSNMFGLYYLPMPIICHETGMSDKKINACFVKLLNIGFCRYDCESEFIFVTEMAAYQIGFLDPKDHKIKALHKAWQALPNNPFIGDFFDKYGERYLLDRRASKGLVKPVILEQEQEIEQEQEQDVVRGNGSALHPPQEIPKKKNNVQQVVEGWKILNGVSADDKAWDKVHFPMNAKFASELLGLFSNSVPDSLDCMESVFDRLRGKGLDLSLKGVVKNSDVYRQMWLERKAKKAVA